MQEIGLLIGWMGGAGWRYVITQCDTTIGFLLFSAPHYPIFLPTLDSDSLYIGRKASHGSGRTRLLRKQATNNLSWTTTKTTITTTSHLSGFETRRLNVCLAIARLQGLGCVDAWTVWTINQAGSESRRPLCTTLLCVRVHVYMYACVHRWVWMDDRDLWHMYIWVSSL
jgi:hypothetical protein